MIVEYLIGLPNLFTNVLAAARLFGKTVAKQCNGGTGHSLAWADRTSPQVGSFAASRRAQSGTAISWQCDAHKGADINAQDNWGQTPL